MSLGERIDLGRNATDVFLERNSKCFDQTDLFFPATKREAAVYHRLAKAVCLGTDGSPPCPVLSVCRERALDLKVKYGVWGGLTARERTRILQGRKLKRAG